MSTSDAAKIKLEAAHCCLDILEKFKSHKINGILKLMRRIQAEIKFLKKVIKNDSKFKLENVECSNIIQLSAIVDVLQSSVEVTGVLQAFSLDDKKIVVDIVAEEGRRWIKVIMRNPEALHRLFIFGERGGTKPLNIVAEEFKQCAQLNPYLYNVPKINFIFVKGVSEELAHCLRSLDIEVTGDIVPVQLIDAVTSDSEDECESVLLADDTSVDSSTPSINLEVNSSCRTEITAGNSSSVCSSINLDVTALVAYVSATANGGCNFTFEDEFLNEQAKWEREYPVKDTLDKYFKGNKLFVCEAALHHFMDIINIIAGPGEKARAHKFIERLIVVKNVDSYQDLLPLSSKIKKVARLVFGTGLSLKAVTITANEGFVRSAENKGIKVAVKLHSPRGLTEMKEGNAVPMKELRQEE